MQTDMAMMLVGDGDRKDGPMAAGTGMDGSVGMGFVCVWGGWDVGMWGVGWFCWMPTSRILGTKSHMPIDPESCGGAVYLCIPAHIPRFLSFFVG